MAKPLKWKQTHENNFDLTFECYGASVYNIDGRWGGEVEGPSWNKIKVFKAIYRNKEMAQKRVIDYITKSLDKRMTKMFFLIEELEHLSPIEW